MRRLDRGKESNIQLTSGLLGSTAARAVRGQRMPSLQEKNLCYRLTTPHVLVKYADTRL